MSRRKKRLGEYVCTCSAYEFPHRFSGGRCSGKFLVRNTWHVNFGGGVCKHCNCSNKEEDIPYCEVLAEQENVKECQAWDEFVQQNEIIVYRKRT